MLQFVREVESSLRSLADCSVFATGKFNARERVQHSLSIRLAWLDAVEARVPLAVINDLGD